MIYDTLEHAGQYRKLSGNLAKALDYLTGTELETVEAGRVEIDGERVFGDYDAGAMLSVIGQATGLYRGDRAGFDTVRQRGMTEDFSWTRSADSYRYIYENL